MGRESTLWRTSTWGMTWSTRCAAVCALRWAPQEGQNPRRFQLNADQLCVAAVAAVQAQSAVGQRAALQERVELVPDELRQVGAGSVFGLGEEGRAVLPHQAVRRSLFRAVALTVVRGAIRRPLGLPADGLHEGPQNGGPHGLKPFAEPQSPCVPPADVCPLVWGTCVRVQPAASGRRDQDTGCRLRVESVSRQAGIADARGNLTSNPALAPKTRVGQITPVQ